MGKTYFPRQEFKALGLSEPALRILEQLADLADTIARTGENEQGLVDVNEGLENAQLSLSSLDARLDIVEVAVAAHGVRLTAAEADISALEGRMTTAESDINALQADMATPIDVKDEGGSPTSVKTIDFVGAGVTVTFGGGTATVTIP